MAAFLKYTVAFVAAVILCSLLASIFSTQFVIAGLQSVGTEISFATRFTMTLRDFAILQTLGLAVSACLLAGFLVAAVCRRFTGGNRTVWFVLAGSVAMVSMLLLMSLQLQLMPVAGARTGFGLFTQAVAGACGGWLFAKMTGIAENQV